MFPVAKLNSIVLWRLNKWAELNNFNIYPQIFIFNTYGFSVMNR